MDRKDFEKVLDQHAKKWWIDVDKGSTGYLTGRVKNGKLMNPYEPNPNGYPVVLEFKTQSEFCTMCCKQVENRLETINIKNMTVRCECGLKYPYSIDNLLR